MNQENNVHTPSGAEPSVPVGPAPMQRQPSSATVQPQASQHHVVHGTQPMSAPTPISNPVQTAMPTTVATPQASDMAGDHRESVPVVKVWSVRGVEYAIMSFTLWAIAISITWVPVALITGSTGFIALSPPLALLLVSLPIFAFFFLRLKKAELADPKMRVESTKRRFSQITQIVSFVVCFVSLLTIVSSILAAMGGESDNVGQTISSALVFLVVWGGLFMYYWRDERKF